MGKEIQEVKPGDFGKNFATTWNQNIFLRTHGVDTCVAIVFYRKGHLGLGHFYKNEEGDMIGGMASGPVDLEDCVLEMNKYGSGATHFFFFAKDLSKEAEKNLVSQLKKFGLKYDKEHNKIGKVVHTLILRLMQDKVIVLWHSMSYDMEALLAGDKDPKDLLDINEEMPFEVLLK